MRLILVLAVLGTSCFDLLCRDGGDRADVGVRCGRVRCAVGQVCGSAVVDLPPPTVVYVCVDPREVP